MSIEFPATLIDALTAEFPNMSFSALESGNFQEREKLKNSLRSMTYLPEVVARMIKEGTVAQVAHIGKELARRHRLWERFSGIWFCGSPALEDEVPA